MTPQDVTYVVPRVRRKRLEAAIEAGKLAMQDPELWQLRPVLRKFTRQNTADMALWLLSLAERSDEELERISEVLR